MRNSSEPCLNAPGLKEMNWDLGRWQPLISDRCFLPWVVKEPSEEEAARARPVSAPELSKLEELWKSNPAATLADLQRPGLDAESAPVLLRYVVCSSYLLLLYCCVLCSYMSGGSSSVWCRSRCVTCV